MPTINKIPMMGYSPIANRKLNQKASNPISANTQNSRDLMSPNAHYGRHAVSFKARITPEAATEFLTNFNFNVAADQLITNNIKNDLKSKTKTLLSIMNLSIKKYPTLKPGALNRLSSLLNHDNTAVRGFTLNNISDSKAIKSVISDLIHPVARCLGMQEHQNVRHDALNTIDAFAKIKPDIVITPELINGPIRRIILEDPNDFNRTSALFTLREFAKVKPDVVVTPELINGPILHTINNDQYKFNRGHALDALREFAKVKPDVVVTPELINGPIWHIINEDPHESNRSKALEVVGECVKANHHIVPNLLDSPIIQRGMDDLDKDVRSAALGVVGECAKAKPDIVPHLLAHPMIERGLTDLHSYVRSAALGVVGECVKAKPDIVPNLLDSPMIQRGMADEYENVRSATLKIARKCVKVKPDIVPYLLTHPMIERGLTDEDENVTNMTVNILSECVKAKPDIMPEVVEHYIAPTLKNTKSTVRTHSLEVLVPFMKNNPKIVPEFIRAYISPHLHVENESSSFVRRYVLAILNHFGQIQPGILTPELLNSIKLLTSPDHKIERKLAISVYNNLAPILEKRQSYALFSAMGKRLDIPHTDENIKNHIFSFVSERLAPPTDGQ